MHNALTPTNILDLTSKQTLFELAIDEQELIGPSGAKLIADIKERAAEAEYTHMYFRDPIRPGIVWFTTLGVAGAGSLPELPTRGRLDQCRRITESAFPGFLGSIEQLIADAAQADDDEIVMSQIPPLTENTNISAVDLVTALEYIVFVYPTMVRAWAALIFTYDEILGCREGAESARQACIGSCPHAQVVAYLVGGWENEKDNEEERIDA